MQAPNPYAAPEAARAAPSVESPAYASYVPLGWRTTFAMLAVASVPATSFALDGVHIALRDRATGEPPDLLMSLLLMLGGLGLFSATVAAAVFFSVWLRRAARNLRGLGRIGMVYTPRQAVTAFYIPFVNLVRPPRVVGELWRASEPEPQADGHAWLRTTSVPSLIHTWWGVWLLAGFISNGAARSRDAIASGGLALVGSALMTVAAVACILVIRGITARQEQAASRLGVGPRL